MKLLILISALFLFSCSDKAKGTEDPEPSRVLKFEKLDEKSRDDILDTLSAFGDAINPIVAGVLFKYGADLYEVEYLTTAPDGREVVASGTITLPQNNELNFPYLSYQHGTVFAVDEVSSVEGADGADGLISIIASSMGYIVFTPDYLGFGASGDEVHPFVHKSLGVNSRDFLAAGKQILDSIGFKGNDSLFIMGYSEGGYATLSLQEELSTNPLPDVDLIASAPMAGPYDMSGTMYDYMINSDSLPFPSYLPYALYGYHSVYDLWDDASLFFKAPFDSIMANGIDRSLGGGELNDIFPTSAEQLLSDSAYSVFSSNENNQLLEILKENDLTNFIPSVPTSFFHCNDDEIIPVANSQIAYDKMLAAGAPVELVLKDYGDHVGCAGQIVLDAIFWLGTY